MNRGLMERDNRLIGAKWPARPLPGADEPAERSPFLAPRGGRHYGRSMTELRRQSTLPIYDSFTCPYAELERHGGQHLRLLWVDLGAAQRQLNVEPERRALGPHAAPRFPDAHALRPRSAPAARGTAERLSLPVAAPCSVHPARDYQGFYEQGRSMVRQCRTPVKAYANRRNSNEFNVVVWNKCQQIPVNPRKRAGWKPLSFANLPPIATHQSCAPSHLRPAATIAVPAPCSVRPALSYIKIHRARPFV